jgi:hypothetical protein
MIGFIFMLLLLIGFSNGFISGIILTAKQLQNWLYLKKKGMSTTGHIRSIDVIIKKTEGEDAVSYLLTIDYYTLKEEIITVQCSRDKDFYKEGMSVPIIYNAKKPNKFLLNDKTVGVLVKEVMLNLFFLLSFLGIIYLILDFIIKSPKF